MELARTFRKIAFKKGDVIDIWGYGISNRVANRCHFWKYLIPLKLVKKKKLTDTIHNVFYRIAHTLGKSGKQKIFH